MKKRNTFSQNFLAWYEERAEKSGWISQHRLFIVPLAKNRVL
jgi:hypothetical protein